MFGQLFPQNATRRTLAINTASQLVGKFFGAGTTFVVSFIIANQLGASGFGDFIKITTYVSFFFLMSDFGLNAAYLQKNDSNALPALIGLRIIGSVVFMTIALSILAFLPQANGQGYTSLVRLGIILFVPAILAQSCITSANAIFQKHLRYDAATAAIIAGSIVTLLTIFVGGFSAIHLGPLLGVVALLLGSITSAIVSLLIANRMSPLSVKFSSKLLLPLFITTIPLGLTLISNVVYSHADSVILALTRPTSEVGTYGMAYKIFELLLVVPTFFMNAMYPLLLQAKKQHFQFIDLIKESVLFLIIISTLMFFVVWILAPYVVYIKSDFVASVVYIRILACSLPLFFLSALTMWVLITMNMQWILALIYTLGMVLNIVLNLLFVPQFGATASAWITVLSEAIILLVCTGLLIPRLSRNHMA